MTNRAEFQPERLPLPEHYFELIEAAEHVIRHKCTGCAASDPKHCLDCAYGPLRKTLEKIRDAKNRMGDGRGQLFRLCVL